MSTLPAISRMPRASAAVNTASVYGIGLNNFSGTYCSMRAVQSPDSFLDDDAWVGAALPCEHVALFDGDPTTDFELPNKVTLWFK